MKTKFSPRLFIATSAIALGILSVALSVVGPKILGRATDLLLAGFMGKNMPAGATKEQAGILFRDAVSMVTMSPAPPR